MLIRMHTIMAHPIYGVCQAGRTIDLPDKAAAEMIAAKVAEAVKPAQRVGAAETAATKGAPETAAIAAASPKARA